jgi:hypothetical protein
VECAGVYLSKLYNIQGEPSSKIVENRGEIKKKFFRAARGGELVM